MSSPSLNKVKRRTGSGGWEARKRGGLPRALPPPPQAAPLRRRQRQQAVDPTAVPPPPQAAALRRRRQHCLYIPTRMQWPECGRNPSLCSALWCQTSIRPPPPCETCASLIRKGRGTKLRYITDKLGAALVTCGAAQLWPVLDRGRPTHRSKSAVGRAASCAAAPGYCLLLHVSVLQRLAAAAWHALAARGAACCWLPPAAASGTPGLQPPPARCNLSPGQPHTRPPSPCPPGGTP